MMRNCSVYLVQIDHVEVVPMTLRFQLVEALFEVLTRATYNAVVCSVPAVVISLVRNQTLRQRWNEVLFARTQAGLPAADFDAMFQWAVRRGHPKQDFVALLHAAHGNFEAVKLRLSRNFEQLDTLQRVIESLEEHSVHDHQDFVIFRNAGIIEHLLKQVTGAGSTVATSVAGCPSCKDATVNSCDSLLHGYRNAIAVDVLCQLVDDADCRRVLLYPVNVYALLEALPDVMAGADALKAIGPTVFAVR